MYRVQNVDQQGQCPAVRLTVPATATTNRPVAVSESSQQFCWATIDGAQIPCLLRGTNKKFTPVRIVEGRLLGPLLARYGQNSLNQQRQRPLLSSYYMTPSEALLLTSHAGSIYGVFSVNDLVVGLDEFRFMYRDVMASSGGTAQGVNDVTGGWIQINNSVIPFITTTENLLPLPVLRNAAGLLTNFDDSLLDVRFPTSDMCQFLNTICQAAGLHFAFGPFTPLVSLRLVCGLCSPILYAHYLPNLDPFSHAQYIDEETGQLIFDNLDQCDVTNGTSLAPRSSAGCNGVMTSQAQGTVTVVAGAQRPIVGVLEPVMYGGKTISSLRKSDGNYVLIEAICRVFFPQHSIEKFIQTVELLLGTNLVSLTAAEEKCFIEFYRLPTGKLRCNKVIRLTQLGELYSRIETLLNAPQQPAQQGNNGTVGTNHVLYYSGVPGRVVPMPGTTTAGTTGTSPVSVPIGTVFKRPPQSTTTTTTTSDDVTHQDDTSRPAKRRRKNVCNDVIEID